jgi:hypothetical protein
MSERPQTPFQGPTDATNIIIQLTTLGVCIALAYLIGEARGWASGMSIAAIAILIELSWPMRREAWFWCAVSAFAAIHVCALLSLDWSWVAPTDQHRSGKGLIGLFWIDLGVMMASVYGLYRLKYGKPAQAIEPSVDELPRYSDHDMTW